MINLTDIYGKTWKFQEDTLDGIYIDNPNPDHLVTVIVKQAKIKAYLYELENALPTLGETIEIKH